MSGVTTLAFRQELLQQRFLGIAPSWSTLAIALTRRVPTTNSSVAQLDEPFGNAYARVNLALGDPDWDLINDNEVANSGTLYFPSATGSWGTIHGWAAIGGTRVVAVGTLNSPLRVVSGVRPYLGPGDIVFGMYD